MPPLWRMGEAMASATVPAFLIFATATVSPNPATQWTAIEYPNRLFCDAKAAEFRAGLLTPESLQRREREGVTIKIAPRCSSEPPQVWITDEVKR
jgi:hypothetical protein